MAKRGVTEFLSAFQDVGITFFDIETDLLIVLDDRGNIARVNPAWERVTGYAESDVIGHGIAQFVSLDDLAVFLRSFSEKHPRPFRLLHHGGGTVACRLVAARFRAGRGYLVLRTV